MKTFSTKPPITEKAEYIKCPVCRHVYFKDLWNLDGYSFKKCKKCAIVYQNPQPIASSVTKRYDNSYFKYEIENEKSFLNLMLLGLKDIKFDLKPIELNSKSILDIGCATGLFLGYMKDLGWDTYGVEVCTEAVNYGNEIRGLNIFNGILDDSPIKDNSMDIIHLSHVIEHINDPDKFVKLIYSKLKPGGIVFCTTPNISGFQAKLFKSRWRSVIPDHLVLFSISSLKSLFKQNNFEILGYKTWGGLCLNSGYPKLFKKVLDKLAKPLGFGDVVIIKAVKPL